MARRWPAEPDLLTLRSPCGPLTAGALSARAMATALPLCRLCRGPLEGSEAVVYPGTDGATCGPCVREWWPTLEAAPPFELPLPRPRPRSVVALRYIREGTSIRGKDL